MNYSEYLLVVNKLGKKSRKKTALELKNLELNWN